MDFDAERLARNKRDLAEAGREISRLVATDVETFLSDSRNTLSLRYLLIQAVESIVDTCQHVLARALGIACEGYVDCILKSGEHGLVDPSLAGKLRRLASLRNSLIHRYWTIDDRRIHEACGENLRDLGAFSEQIERYLRKA